jgi:TetR/AcrR family transcriptional regulator, mexJK operon transcriptional repressor
MSASGLMLSGKVAKAQAEGTRRRGRPPAAVIEARNAELLDRALDLFLEHGFALTTIEMISASLGMGRRTIYARYGDKETLFRAALQKAIDEWIVPVEELRNAEAPNLEATLLGVARLWISRIRKPSGWRLVRIAATEAFTRPDVAAYLRGQMSEGTIGYVADLLSRHRVPRAEDAAAAFMILIVEGTVQHAVWDGGDAAELDRQTAYRVRLFLEGAKAG